MKIKYILPIIIIILIIIPYLNKDKDNSYLAFNTNGVTESSENITAELICPKVVLEDSEFTCNIKLNNINKKVHGIDLVYNINQNFSYISFKESDVWNVEASSSIKTIMTNEEGITGNIEVGKLKMKTTTNANNGEKYKVSLDFKLVFGDNIDEYTNIKDISTDIYVVSPDDIFNYIKINDETIEISELKDEYNIVVENNVSSIKIDSSIKDEYIDYINLKNDYGNRTISNLEVGNNEIYYIIESNGYEVLKLLFNVKRKNEEGKVIDNIEENPKTGFLSIIVIMIILTCSLVLILNQQKKLIGGES